QNYRSTKMILDAANEVISKNTKRYPKRLWSDQGDGEPIVEVIVEEDRAEAEMVAEEILHLKNNPDLNFRFWDFAILFRSNAQSRLFEEALRMRKMPYRIVGGMSFLERKEIRDSLSYLKLLANPHDDASFRRMVNYPARGLGKTSLDYLNTEALNSGESLHQVAKRVQQLSAIQTKSRETLERFANWFDAERERYSQLPFDLPILCDYFKKFFADIGLKQAILDDNENPVQAEKKWENVEELINAFGQLELPEDAEPNSLTALIEFLGMMMLDPDQKDDDKDKIKDEIILLSLHGSKGLEYPVVFLVGMEEGLLPHRRTIEEGTSFDEERRLAYVGITRAKKKLYLTRCANRMRYGKKVPRLPSRFTEDIPLHLKLIQNESEVMLPLADEKAREEHEVKVKDFLAQIRANISKK
ncbi:MAG: ATP-dependent DNA helicase Rep, partial [Proteobacteria bacterium]